MGHWLVIDLEATTDDGGWPVTEMEVIEIGASLVTREGREVDHFQRFVKPRRRPQLTPFCRELTHSSQADVDNAAPFREVWASFERWLGHHRGQLQAWVSWGDYDRQQLDQDCAFHQIPNPIEQPHINAKREFARRQGLKKRPGLGGAIAEAGLVFEGTQHRGIDDARNIARLLPYAFGHARIVSNVGTAS